MKILKDKKLNGENISIFKKEDLKENIDYQNPNLSSKIYNLFLQINLNEVTRENKIKSDLNLNVSEINDKEIEDFNVFGFTTFSAVKNLEDNKKSEIIHSTSFNNNKNNNNNIILTSSDENSDKSVKSINNNYRSIHQINSNHQINYQSLVEKDCTKKGKKIKNKNYFIHLIN